MAVTPTGGPLLTVLMPVFNAQGYVAAAARSILDDDVADLELLVIDDGSTDDGVAELTAIGDPRIRVVPQANAGLVSALNRGLDEARGRFLARMDADDLSVPGRLAAQLGLLTDNPRVVMCGTDYELFGAITGRVRMPRSDRACRQRLVLASCHCGPSVMMRRDVVERAGLRFDPVALHAEDYEFFTRMAAHGDLANVGWPAYRYRVHRDQVSARHADLQRAIHLRVAAVHAARSSAGPLADEVLATLLWPDERYGVARTTVATAAAGGRALLRNPGLETARFAGRRVVEAGLAAARR